MAGDAPYMEAMQKKYVVVQLSDNEGEILEVDPALISAFESFRPAGGWTLHDNYWLAWGKARLKGLHTLTSFLASGRAAAIFPGLSATVFCGGRSAWPPDTIRRASGPGRRASIA
jgi:hypothetical protein